MFSGYSYRLCIVPLTIVATKNSKISQKKYWPKWSDQMIKYIFQTLKKYFDQRGQTILATTKTLRFYHGHNGLTEFTYQYSD